MTVGLFLALASLGVLIYFIHHAAESIQAENVIGEVSRELQRAIDRLYPERLGANPAKRPRRDTSTVAAESTTAETSTISSPVSDYLQSIDVERLLELSKRHDLVLSVVQRPGKFCVQGGDLLKVQPQERADESVVQALKDCFYFGSRRTLVQDVEYAIDQLVEVAVRALSPGVNDPFTAVNCVDRIGAALCTLVHREFPSRFRVDDAGTLRVVTNASTESGIIDACFDQIRQASTGNVSLTIRLLETINEVARHSQDERIHASLWEQAQAIHRGSERASMDLCDRRDVEAQFAVVKASIISRNYEESETPARQ